MQGTRESARRPIAVRAATIAAALVASIAVVTTPSTPAGATPAADEVMWFGSRTSDQAVVLKGNRRATFDVLGSAAQVLAGDFFGDGTSSAIYYQPGLGADSLVHLADDGTTLTPTVTPLHIGGAFRPIVADLDRNGATDVLWYARGGTSDFLWLFQPGGGHTSFEVRIDGSYIPIPFLIDGTGTTIEAGAILWYRPGPGPDSIWTFNGPGGPIGVRSMEINGDYTPVVGHFTGSGAGGSHQQILWYDRTGRNTTLWKFAAGKNGRHTSEPTAPIGPGFRPSAGEIEGFGDVVHWYKPGPGGEKIWIWGDGNVTSGAAGDIDGTYPTIVDGQGRRPLDSLVLLGPGASAKSQQLNPESAPTLFAFTKIPNLPPDPVGTWADAPQDV